MHGLVVVTVLSLSLSLSLSLVVVVLVVIIVVVGLVHRGVIYNIFVSETGGSPVLTHTKRSCFRHLVNFLTVGAYLKM